MFMCSAGCAMAMLLVGGVSMAQHPRVLVNAETLPLLRAKAADGAANQFGFTTKSAWETLKAKADGFVNAEAYHYSVNIPLDNNRFAGVWEYTLSDATPPRHNDSPAYPPWTAMFQERPDSITTRLIHLSFAYLVTGEPAYAEAAKTMALHVAKWEQWTDPSYGAGNIKACLDTGHCTYAMAMCYDWCFDQLTDAERAEIRDATITKGIQACLADVDRYPAETNGYAVITCGATLGAIAVQPEAPEAGGYLATCIEKIRTSLDKGGQDGGAFEGPMYGTYLIDSFATALDGLEAAHVKHDLFEHPYLATMPRYCISQMAPDTKQMPCFGDGGPTAGYPQIMSILAHRGSTDAAWYLQQIGALAPDDLYGFIRFDAAKLHPKQPDRNPSVPLVDIGYASLRDGYNAQAPSLFFKSGPYENVIGHNHYDHNAFVVSYGGEWILPDRGYHSFYDPAKRKFSLGSLGHNTIVLDLDEAYLQRTTVPDPGHDQAKVTGGRIAEFFAGEAFDYVKGQAAEAYNTKDLTVLDRFDRGIVYVKPHFFLVHDTLASPAPHAFSFLLHSDSLSLIEPEGDAFKVTRTTSEVYGRLVSSSRTALRVETYPGAESYGSYLRVETEPTTDTTFTAFLYPRPNVNPKFIRNGGFEQGMAGWRPRANEDLPNHTIVDEQPAEGAKCARIEKSGYYYSDYFALPVGTEVTARARFRTTALAEGQGATMTLYFWQGGKAFANRRVGPFAGEGWQEQSVTTTVPEGTDQICLALEFFAPGVGWFDDVRIEANIEPPTAITPQIAAMDSNALDVTIGAERFLASLGAPGRSREANGLTTDAEIAVVALNAQGQPTRAFVKSGSIVTLDGRPLLRLDQPGTAEASLREDGLRAQVTYDVTPHAPLADRAALETSWRPAAAQVNGKPARVEPAGEGARVVLE